MKQSWTKEELAEHWSILPDERRLFCKKTDLNRLAFITMVKFFQYTGRFFESLAEVPKIVISHLAEQIRLFPENLDFIFASRYSGKNSGSEDDSFITYIGNKIFSFLGNFLFHLNLKDILYTYVLGKTSSFKLCNLNCSDFRICVEFPINIKELGFIYNSYSSFEKKRLFGKKKVNEIKDGFLIFYYMIYRFFKKLR